MAKNEEMELDLQPLEENVAPDGLDLLPVEDTPDNLVMDTPQALQARERDTELDAIEADVVKSQINQPGAYDDIVAGAKQFATDILPIGNQIAAGVTSLFDTDPNRSYSEKYRASLEEFKANEQIRKQVYPTATGVGTGLAYTAQTIPLFRALGLGVKTAGVIAKFGQAAATMGLGASVTTANKTAKSIISNDVEYKDVPEFMADEFASSMEGELLGFGLATGVTGAFKLTGWTVSKSAGAIAQTRAYNAIQDVVEVKSKDGVKAVKDIYNKYGKENVDALFSKIKVDKTVDPTSVSSRVKVAKDEAGTILRESYSDIDEILPDSMDGGELLKGIDSIINRSYASREASSNITAVKEKIANEFTDRFGNAVTSRKMGLTQVWDYINEVNSGRALKDLDSKTKSQVLGYLRKSLDIAQDNAPTKIREMRRTAGQAYNSSYLDNVRKQLQEVDDEILSIKDASGVGGVQVVPKTSVPSGASDEATEVVAPTVNEVIDNLFARREKLSNMLDKGTKALDNRAASNLDDMSEPLLLNRQRAIKKARKEYAMLSDLEENVISKLEHVPNPDELSGALLKSFTKHILSGTGGLIGAAGAVASGGIGAAAVIPYAAARSIKDNLNEIIKYTTNDQTASNLMRYSNVLKKIGDLPNDSFMGSISSQLFNALNDESMSDSDFIDLVYDMDGRSNMYINPLPRTLDGLRSRSSDYSNTLSRIAPDLFAQINTALDNQDDNKARELFDSFAKLPESAKFFQAGTGIDGILFGADREQAAISIQNDIKYNSYQRAQIANEVRQTGKMPDMSSLQRQPRTYAPRDKNKVR